MNIKQILLHVDEAASCESRIRAAAAFAKQHQANLLGLYVLEPVFVPHYAEAHIPKDVLENHEATRMEAVEKSKQRFKEITQAAGVATEWRLAKGPLLAELTEAGKYVDVIILGQDFPARYNVSEHDRSDNLAMSTGRPVLYVPTGGAVETIGQRVVIAWNGSRESVRAINEALPILENAESVTIVSVRRDSEQAKNDKAIDAIYDHLKQHGVEATVKSIPGRSLHAGKTMLAEIEQDNADLLVMGAYGHSRLFEFVLGGMTHHVLKNMTTPVLMAH